MVCRTCARFRWYSSPHQMLDGSHRVPDKKEPRTGRQWTVGSQAQLLRAGPLSGTRPPASPLCTMRAHSHKCTVSYTSLNTTQLCNEHKHSAEQMASGPSRVDSHVTVCESEHNTHVAKHSMPTRKRQNMWLSKPTRAVLVDEVDGHHVLVALHHEAQVLVMRLCRACACDGVVHMCGQRN